MKRDLVGENVPFAVVKREQLHFPRGFFKNHEWVQGSPALEPETIKDATRCLMERKVNEPTLVINGTGDGHIPIGALSLEQRLLKGYSQLGQFTNLKRMQAEMERYGADYSLSNIQEALIRLHSRHVHSGSNDPALVKQMARAELRRVLCHSDPMLEAIGEALDRGIQVQMGTQVTFAKPNLSTYEIGSILKFIGVKEFPEKSTMDRHPSKL